MKHREKASRGTLRRLLKATKRYRGLLILSLFSAALSVLLMHYIPILVGNAIDLIIEPNKVDFEGILPILLRIAVCAAACALFTWIMNAVNNRIVFGIVRDVRNEAFEKLQDLPLSYIDTHAHGEIVSRVIADADGFSDGLLMGFSQLFTGVLTILGTLTFMFIINYRIALVVVLVTPLSLFAASLIARRTYSMFRLQSEARGELTAYVNEIVSGEKVVRAYGREALVTERFGKINKKLEAYAGRAVFYSSTVNPTTRFVNGIVYAGVGLVGALSVISDPAFTVGALSVFLSYANQYTKPFNEISGVVTEMQNALACADRLFSLIDAEPQAPDTEDAVLLTDAEGKVRFSDVSFSYTPEKPLIRRFSLDVPSGKHIAIVGPTGCGKTTLIGLLMRFYDIDAGELSVDGISVSRITRKSLRTSYGMVLQETWLKSGTVRENIAIGKPEATDEEIIAAAKAAHAHSFIKRLPQGYDTVISDDFGLSQGQKQLLSIARVMLCLPPMLILDEATSSIDTRTEMKIQSAFSLMMKGRTSFIVAHRLSTIREADLILVMRDGSIVESGTHNELLEKGGFYATLYNSQFSLTEAASQS